jgi:hypothetical protein
MIGHRRARIDVPVRASLHPPQFFHGEHRHPERKAFRVPGPSRSKYLTARPTTTGATTITDSPTHPRANSAHPAITERHPRDTPHTPGTPIPASLRVTRTSYRTASSVSGSASRSRSASCSPEPHLRVVYQVPLHRACSLCKLHDRESSLGRPRQELSPDLTGLPASALDDRSPVLVSGHGEPDLPDREPARGNAVRDHLTRVHAHTRFT